ncbi:Signal peptidase I V [Posidoniimonas polymericola]|uniref:Signal peptidase I n=1 Tax=Posidoniimonas polymericola TaxID=2528002 RepID=A0A5C5YQI5_9BACT|nr:signal peptidase I [Posidoniimonas polymericola]TWT77020.1 Signal peptidase I V [Posidoniimonas polymericola]
MGKKTKNKRRGPEPVNTTPLPKKRAEKDPRKHGQATRETVESLVIAFVLAFLFRTFQAEAFVIPTGSMAPTLMGRHADMHCPECGQRYRINESELTDSDVDRIREMRGGRVSPAQIMAENRGLAGQCPNCRRINWLGPVNGIRESQDAVLERSYSGDRILVNKYLYSFTDPQRWDVVVFKYPGDAVQNYIKRLVGLPGEELEIKGGDLFVRENDSDEFKIVRKPPKKIMAVRQLVYDSAREPAELRQAGYPLRWTPANDGWTAEEAVNNKRVDLAYQAKATDDTSWLRYSHIPANAVTWATAERTGIDLGPDAKPQLITDYNAYNTTIDGQQLRRQDGRVALPTNDQGLHWVGDLIVDAEVDIASDEGKLVLELVEAGCRFRCTFEVADGSAELTALPFGSTAAQPIAACGKTGVRGDGSHELRMANVDSRLTVWVDGGVLKFDKPTDYDAQELLASDGGILPQQDDANPGDLSPAGIGAEGLEATVDRVTLWRDIYYIAEKNTKDDVTPNRGWPPSDFLMTTSPGEVAVKTDNGPVTWYDMMHDPAAWDAFRARRSQTFKLGEDQFFVMGDNSAASSDARLWAAGNGGKGGIPGGPYLERKMLIGKAVCVYWPHSFDRLPGTSIPFPLFPNVRDMRLVR